MANFSKRTWEKISSCLTNTLGNKAKTVLLEQLMQKWFSRMQEN